MPSPSFYNQMGKSKVTFKEDFRYKNYPARVNLDPDSQDHADILKILLGYAKESYDVMRVRHPSWAELDRKLNGYIDLSEEEQSDKEEDKRRPVSMVVPLSYATRETLMTYRMAALMEAPIFKYDWFDPRDALGTIMLQKLISLQASRRRMGLDLHTHWMDDVTYGFGAVGGEFVKEQSLVTRKRKSLFGSLVDDTQLQTVYEGNSLFAFDPYNCLPDPNVPIHKVKDMVFFGGLERTNYFDLSDYERDDPDVFNVKYLKEMVDTKSLFYSATETTTGRYATTKVKPNDSPWMFPQTKPIDIMWMYAKLIPADFKLGKEKYTQIWKFGVAGDRVIIYAKPLANNHGRIPVAVTASNTDDHSTVPTSLLEIEYPIQHAVDWLWSSHVIELRKSINNMLVIDPSMININDVLNTKYGMIARLRARAFGRGVKDSIMQLQVSDATRGNITDIGFLMDIKQRVTAATDQMQGFQNRRGERVSATEARDTRMSNLSRLEKNARIVEMQGHFDLAYMLASNTIQYMSQETYVKTAGDYEEVLRDEYGITEEGLIVSPDALDINYDILVRDGSLPQGDTAEVWQQLLAITQASPELYQRIDFTRVWLHIARLLGAKNPQEFMKRRAPQARIEPEGQIESQVQAGNYVTPAQLGVAR